MQRETLARGRSRASAEALGEVVIKASRLTILVAALALAPVGAFAQDTNLGKAEFDAN